MKIQFEKNPEQIELIKALASDNKTVALEAQEAFAAFISTVVQQVLEQAGTASMIYRDVEFDDEDAPSIPLDLYYGQNEGSVSVWSQTVGGGLPTNFVQGMQEMKINTYRLDSAISMDKRYVRRARLDVVAAGLERMANEILVKQERNAWAVILKLLAEASTQGTRHILKSTASDVFQLDDMNRLWTLVRRLNSAYTGGTPQAFQSRGLTDLFVSPEVKAQIRAFAYQPMNTRSGKTETSGATSIALPDSVREQIYRAAGATEIFGVTINEMLELGTSRKYNDLFSTFAGSTAYDGGSAFVSSSSELIVGIDASRNAFLRPVAVQSESRGQVKVLPDDQFLSRSQKVGFYSFVEEGRVAVDARAAVGLIVT
ncbi:MAG: hypothetical protein RL736_55 [Pseudomonadota bacterium]|jgi:hypothetical protein